MDRNEAGNFFIYYTCLTDRKRVYACVRKEYYDDVMVAVFNDTAAPSTHNVDKFQAHEESLWMTFETLPDSTMVSQPLCACVVTEWHAGLACCRVCWAIYHSTRITSTFYTSFQTKKFPAVDVGTPISPFSSSNLCHAREEIRTTYAIIILYTLRQGCM